MVKVTGKVITPDGAADLYMLGGKEREIIERMHTNTSIYEYSSMEQLIFELKLRAQIIEASVSLKNSGFKFSTFRKSICNGDYWNRTAEGGFRKNNSISSLAAINDIFTNGNKYASECATAIIIIYYKAIGSIFPGIMFNKVFENIYLMNWKDLDDSLGITTHSFVREPLPGDCLYFKNPEVNPLTPQWQGENTIYHGGDKYYGHGIGLTTAQGIIDALNKRRKSGATQSAYLLNTATRLNFKRLYGIFHNEYSYDISA